MENMIWNNFIWFAIATVGSWIISIISLFYVKQKGLAELFAILGIIILSLFTTLLWIEMDRPPFKTMGETRLWYSIFLSTTGLLIYFKWHYKWLLSYSMAVATIFVLINILKPDIHSKYLMPALQSIWFIPHVTSYIISYAMLGAAAISGVAASKKVTEKDLEKRKKLEDFTDKIVMAGLGFLLAGMLMGAVWAKEAWGHYWSWDPKETWAFITACAYILYIHMRRNKEYSKMAFLLLPAAFILLLITWLGVSFMPWAQGSIHVY